MAANRPGSPRAPGRLRAPPARGLGLTRRGDWFYNETPDPGLAVGNPAAEGRSLPAMNPDPTRPEPGDDVTAPGAAPDLVDTIALEAVTAAAVPRPEEEEDPAAG